MQASGSIFEFFASVWARAVTAPHMLAVLALLGALLLVDAARRGWRLWSRTAVTGALATASIFHLNLLFVPLLWVSSGALRGLWGDFRLPDETWAGISPWLLTPLVVLVYDFCDYWTHRILHVRWLWPIHAIHHSDQRVNGLTAYRVHFLEGLAMWSAYALALTWMGLPVEVIGFATLFRALHNVYVHIDVDWNHGPFHFLLASPRFHRWHHADDPAAYDKNLANVFPVWDVMFGTYRNLDSMKADEGAGGVPHADVVQLMLWPFLEWRKMIAQSGIASAFARPRRQAE